METKIIDKLAFIYLKDAKVLMARSRGKDIFYIPGGKREGNETDEQALMREVSEELNVAILPATMRHYGNFKAQAHGKPEGVIVKMTCYTAEFNGVLMPGSEINALAFYDYSQRGIVGPVCRLIFDDLKAKKLIN